MRALVLLLALANAAYFAWRQDYLAPWGFGPAQQSEPERLEQQIKPDALKLKPPPSPLRGQSALPNEVTLQRVPAATATATATATSTAGEFAECLQAGVFDEFQLAALRPGLQSLPEGSWRLEPAVEPGRWVVYMGRYTDPALLAAKRGELRALNVEFDAITASNSALAPGLSLGRFSSPERAEQGLAIVTARGVRSARVMNERPEVVGQQLVLPAVNAELRSQLAGLTPALAGKALQACR
jgi:hypothetical protein